MRALLDDDEVVDLAESLPNFGKLGGEQFSKEWPDANIGKKIAASSDGRAIAGIIAVLGMIKCLFHEPGERLWAALFYFCADPIDQSWIAGAHWLNRSAYGKNYGATRKSLNGQPTDLSCWPCRREKSLFESVSHPATGLPVWPALVHPA